MSALTIATLVLIAVVILGLIVVIADEIASRFGRTEAYRLSTRDLPNVAPPIGATDTERVRR